MEKKLRHSHQREMIYEYLLASKEHPSAEMVYEDLKTQIPNLSLGTVYRNLRLLEELGKVRKVTTLNNVERFDAWCEDHIHFVCEECGKVIDLPYSCSEVINSIKIKEHDVAWASLIMGGTCASCRKKGN